MEWKGSFWDLKEDAKLNSDGCINWFLMSDCQGWPVETELGAIDKSQIVNSA